MILDNINNFLKYARSSESSLLAYDFIMNFKKKELPVGRYELDGDRCYALVQEYETAPESEKDFESHRRYIDLQYIIEGCEEMYWQQTNSLEEKIPYNEEADVAFYSGSVSCRFQVRADEFVVFYPQDGHKPGCCVQFPDKVRKIVIKMLID